MTTITFDTYKVVSRLQKKGYTKEQAEGFIEAVQEINLDEIASKADLKTLAAEIKYDILKWMIPLFLGLYALILKLHF